MKSVWIIDDEASIRFTLKEALSREGIPTLLFSSAEQALKELGTSSRLVIVSDIRMPGLSGLDLLRQLNKRNQRPPVIIMTAYSDLESAVAVFQDGAFDYLPKPFDLDHAVKLIKRAAEENSNTPPPLVIFSKNKYKTRICLLSALIQLVNGA